MALPQIGGGKEAGLYWAGGQAGRQCAYAKRSQKTIMDDFGAFCYLDVPKTGSSFICGLLQQSSRTPLLFSLKHAFARLDAGTGGPGLYREGTIYFNSVRHPFRYYASLYNYGCDGKGGLFLSLRGRGFGHLYDGTLDGFANWMEFIHARDNAVHLGEGMEGHGAGCIGLLTHRFLRLSLAAPMKKMFGLHDVGQAFDLYQRERIVEFTVRNEFMKPDLMGFLSSRLSDHVDLDKADAILSGPRVNASRSRAISAADVERSAVAALVCDRDALIFKTFYGGS